MADGENRAGGSQTVARALDILDEVIRAPVKTIDLSRKLGLTRPTTYRLAQTLRARGYLSATPDGFSLGPKLLRLGAVAKEQIDPVRIARAYLEALAERTGFCTFIGRRDGDRSLHMDRVTGRQRLRVSTSPGDHRPIAETGLGKALLLDDDAASLKRLYRQARGEAFSEADFENWLAAFEESTRRGVVLHESYLGDGVRSIAVPIRDAAGGITAAISIAGAEQNLDVGTMARLAGEVQRTAQDIEAALGHESRKATGAESYES